MSEISKTYTKWNTSQFVNFINQLGRSHACELLNSHPFPFPSTPDTDFEYVCDVCDVCDVMTMLKLPCLPVCLPELLYRPYLGIYVLFDFLLVGKINAPRYTSWIRCKRDALYDMIDDGQQVCDLI